MALLPIRRPLGFICLLIAIVLPLSAANPSQIAALNPEFSVERGYYTAAFNLAISSPDGGTIRYTLDGTSPSTTQGAVYSGPIPISGTTVVRAVAFGGGLEVSGITTHSYLFIADIKLQPGMLEEVVNHPVYGAEMDDSFLSVPTVSLAMDSTVVDTLRNRVSMEFIDPNGGPEFHIDTGVKRYGNASLRDQIPNMRFYFQSEFGPTKLEFPLYTDFATGAEHGIIPADRFDQIQLRHGSGDSLRRFKEGIYIRNRFMDELHLTMGIENPHGRFVQVFMNGEYWGVYHFRERMEASFMESYFGGDKADYDAINKHEPSDGTADTWNFMRDSLTTGAEIAPYLDEVKFVDYMLAAFYNGCNDWSPDKNWNAAGTRAPGGPQWIFQTQDADHCLFSRERTVSEDITDEEGPGKIWGKLIREADPEFMMLVADRIQKHFFSNGALTPQRVIDLVERLRDALYLPMVAETARWGDCDVRFCDTRTSPLWDRDDEWMGNLNIILNDILPTRTDTSLAQLVAKGWFPSVMAPRFNAGAQSYDQFVGEVPAGFILEVGNPNPGNAGTTYYTTDGSDPRSVGGAIAGTSGGDFITIPISGTMTVNARVRQAGVWSPLQTATFYAPQMLDKLVINEIHYHPLDEGVEGDPGFVDGDEFEFIEILNTSAETLQLQGVRLAGGIDFTFPADTPIEPGGFVVVAENQAWFASRNGFEPDGQYSGKLSNSGESVVLKSPSGTTLDSLAYGDVDPWPMAADGSGPSLSLSPAAGLANDDPGQWFASQETHGTPNAVNNQAAGVTVRMNLSGAWTESGMTTALKPAGLLPESHPYPGVPAKTAPPAFLASRSDLVDWVWIELRTTPEAASAVFSGAYFVSATGLLIDVDGSSTLRMTGVPDGDYLLVAGHRNHLSIITPNPVTIGVSSVVSVDFVSASGAGF